MILYDLVGRDDRRFSPNCWRARLALAHKGLAVDARPTRFIDVSAIGGERYKTIPVLEHGEQTVCDSWAIANFLEQNYPDRPSLFGGESGPALTAFINAWVDTALHPALIGLIVLDIHDHLLPEDQDYFRRSREQRFGKTLEQVQAGREQRLEGFQKSLHPIRFTVKRQPFLGGERPLYADYLAFSAFQWARVSSPFTLLRGDDPVFAWRQRCLDLFDGLAKTTPAYD